jgi:hypothetical protein
LTACASLAGAGAGAAPFPSYLTPANNRWPHDVVAGISSRSGNGYALVYADGFVLSPIGSRVNEWGGAEFVPLNAPIVGSALRPHSGSDGRRPPRIGYWLVAADGGVFAFGWARNKGGMSGAHLNQPIVAIAPTSSGTGYWLIARDGGVFSFGDARFHGSTGNLRLQQPIVGAAGSPVGQGYRMVARDGGIFAFGNAGYYGSLPGKGLRVDDVVGVASTPTSNGYWIARANGEVTAFGDAQHFVNKSYRPSACDPVVTVFTNPREQGFRLGLESGVTIPFGRAPAGPYTLHAPDDHLIYGSPLQCAS